jgi:hypothetical protein
MTDKLYVTVSKTSKGDQDYMQIMSSDMTSINIVLIAGRIEIKDARKTIPAVGGLTR